ncbi:MAG: peptidylprolyl isomerase, partial [Marinirhabdus sp.]
AHKLLKTIRQKAVNGEDFVALAKQHSQEPGAKERGGALGWFSAFSMVYPFEQAAYNTPVGEISNVVRTRFGYHILKVNARRPRGAPVAVSHIMVTDNTGERTFKPEERINEVYNLLQQGSRFEDLAKQYSDDKNSARNGGKLRTFARGELRSEIFVNKAYENPTPGAISKPFRSEFGWHIIRFEEQLPQPTYEEKEAELLDRVKQGQRLNIINTAVTNKIKEKYGYTEGATIEPFYSTYVTGAIVKKTWRADTLSPTKNKTLFTIGDKTVTYNDFAFYLQKYQRTKRFAKKNQYIREGYDSFKDEVLKDYFKKKLEEDNKAYAAVINEYRDGLLIFDVMNINVWNRAKQDSVGLQKYYGTVKHNHMWKKRFKGITVSATNKAHAAQAAALLKENKTAGTIKKTLNTNGKTNVVVSEGTFEAGNHRVIPAAFQFKEGVSPVMPTENGYTVVKAEKIMPPTVKTLNEVRGKIMSGHQKKTEKEWVAGLRKKHTVKVNKRTLKKVIKTLE